METKESLMENLLKAADKEFGTTKGYASIEDMLRRVGLKQKENLTIEEARELERLESLPLEPELQRAFDKLSGKESEEQGS